MNIKTLKSGKLYRVTRDFEFFCNDFFGGPMLSCEAGEIVMFLENGKLDFQGERPQRFLCKKGKIIETYIRHHKQGILERVYFGEEKQ